MQLIPFVAESAIDAVNQIRAQLGPDAVVVNVRQLPADGLARLWQKPKIEVLAYKPEPAARLDVVSPRIPEESFPQPVQQVEPFPVPTSAAPPAALPIEPPNEAPVQVPPRSSSSSRWKIASVLESSGFLPMFAERVLDQIQARHGTRPPAGLGEELALARGVLSGMWRPARPVEEGSDRPHVLVGPAGAGKTTCLCKWLTHAVLMEGKRVQVWRLDGVTANTAEALAIYCDVLGVPMERSWQQGGEEEGAMKFLDYPGVDWRDAGAIREFGKHLARIGSPRIHLVLNAAYEVPILLAQARAFAALPVEDLVFSHLDEEVRWGKLWQLIMGTNFPVRFLSAGQNIPGEFSVASAERIFSRQFPT